MFGKYQALLWFWGILLLAALLVLSIGAWQWSQSAGFTSGPLPIQPETGEDGDPKPGIEVGEPDAPWMLGLSIVTAVISAAGFMGTTFFALRTDRRQAALHELQLANLRAEIELQALEIERLRRAQPSSKKKPQ